MNHVRLCDELQHSETESERFEILESYADRLETAIHTAQGWPGGAYDSLLCDLRRARLGFIRARDNQRLSALIATAFAKKIVGIHMEVLYWCSRVELAERL